MKKSTVTGIIGAISGLVTIKTAHNFFKEYQGKVGPVGVFGRIVTEAALGTVAAGASMIYAEKCIKIGEDIYNEVVKRMDDEDGEDGKEHRWKAGMPTASCFVSEQDFLNLSMNPRVDVRELIYYTEDDTLTDNDDVPYSDSILADKIKEQLKDTRDEWNGSSGEMYYFERHSEYYDYKLATLYLITIDEVKIKEEEDGGES